MKTFIITTNDCLSKETRAFYNCDYTNMGAPGNPDFINVVKNDNGGTRTDYRGVHMSLSEGCAILDSVLRTDLPQIRKELGIDDLTICTVPRSKKESSYPANKLMFKKTISRVSQDLVMRNGTDYIIRVVNTRTTHKSFNDIDGRMPYPGITKDTCSLSPEIQGKDILLIDDIYTKSVNIDEDCIQALLDAGAKSVAFYAIGKTVKKF